MPNMRRICVPVKYIVIFSIFSLHTHLRKPKIMPIFGRKIKAFTISLQKKDMGVFLGFFKSTKNSVKSKISISAGK